MDGIEGRKTPFPSCFRAFSSSSSSSAVRPNPNRLPSSLFARRPLPLSPSLVEWGRERVLIRSLLRPPPPPPPPPSPSSVSASPPERGDETTAEGFFAHCLGFPNRCCCRNSSEKKGRDLWEVTVCDATEEERVNQRLAGW